MKVWKPLILVTLATVALFVLSVRASGTIID
jgi:hypothetical protein